MSRNNSVSEILKTISDAKNILVISHTNPDADAYGSSCGLSLALKNLGKEVICINESGVNQKFNFIPGVLEIVSETPNYLADLIIYCDCGDAQRIGDRLKNSFQGIKSISIDHHVSNNFFADLNYVDITFSSTSEIIYFLIQEFNWDLSPDLATCLLAGIFGDTGSFRYSSTTATTFSAAAKLIEAGASLSLIADGLFGSAVLEEIQMQSEAISQMKMFCDQQLAIISVTPELVAKYGVAASAAEGLAEKGRDISGVKISVLIRWDDPIWKVSLRSRNSDFNVAKVAEEFGGGGHIQAAAFRWRRSLTELESELITRLKRFF